MLKLVDIKKYYGDGSSQVAALNGVSISFRKSEFVSILGPSGCGKTTLLNIIGGLDRYSYGDLIINKVSTKHYKDRDWDSYRNHSIGFVFQTYNLIPHLSVLNNVELALTISGISKEDRRKKALKVLNEVGLSGQEKKRPNQLSGGQMQRVAIARALINDPEVILADEPTGALDSVTSIQIMELMKEVAKDRLVIMVTHNPDIANRYSTRIIRILDGIIVDDSAPYDDSAEMTASAGSVPVSPKKKAAADLAEGGGQSAEAVKSVHAKQGGKGKKHRPPKTSMSIWTAIYSSFMNLISKRGRTIMTCFAGSIGIIGIALVLSVSAGFTRFINTFQQDNLAEFPLSIVEYNMDMNTMMSFMQGGGPQGVDNGQRPPRYPSEPYILPYSSPIIEQLKNMITRNYFNMEYLEYLNNMDKSWVSGIAYYHAYDFRLVSKRYETYDIGPLPLYHSVDMVNAKWQELIDNPEYMATQYDVLNVDGRMPEAYNEVALVVDRYNRISVKILDALGISYYQNGDEYQTISFDKALETEFSLILNDSYYELGSKNYYEPSNRDEDVLFEEGVKLNLVGIIRQSRDASMSWVGTGLIYHSSLIDYVVEIEKESEIVKAQEEEYQKYLTALETNAQAKLTDVTTGKAMRSEWQPYLDMMSMMGFGALANAVTFTAEDLLLAKMQHLGGTIIPSEIYIYPSTFENKAKIMNYLDEYNIDKEDSQKISYVDSSGNMFSMIETIINAVSYVLVAFSAISLVVSSIMIGIITYVSVIERTKEIGVLRSLGARKRDISRIFNAETLIIGASAGIIGVFISWIMSIIISAILKSLSGIAGLSYVQPIAALSLVCISIVLTVVSGLIPSRIAADKDPVVALRTE